MPDPLPTVITTTDALAAFCAEAARAPYVTVDTEFLRETTYWPKLCLVQLAAPGIEAVVDPLAPGIDLSPMFALMQAPPVKVFHAGRQDIEIVHNLSGIIPAPVFDTQIAAMVCGFGESASYGSLVAKFCKRNLDKSSRFTDWSRRPLSDRQLIYALADVTYLRVIYEKLTAMLAEAGRASWVDEEIGALVDPALYRVEPVEAWKRLRMRVRSQREMAILMEVAAWRETLAQANDVPRGRILKDEALYDVVTQAPASVADLAQLRSIHDGFSRSARGRDLVEAVARGLARDVTGLPKPKADLPPPPQAAAVIDLLRVLLKAVSADEDVAAKLLATSDDLEAIAIDDAAPVPALSGWRRELFGERALALKAGRLALSVSGGQVVISDIAPVAHQLATVRS